MLATGCGGGCGLTYCEALFCHPGTTMLNIFDGNILTTGIFTDVSLVETPKATKLRDGYAIFGDGNGGRKIVRGREILALLDPPRSPVSPSN